MRIWTVGHSTHSADEFSALLKGHGIKAAVDVRAFPGSKRYPHFAREALEVWLHKAGVDYVWLGKELGGRRRKFKGESPNRGIRVEGFRNYADYMLTEEFRAGVDRLLSIASSGPTAFFCAELLWWQCHRSFIADYLAEVRGWDVLHIQDAKDPKPHKLRIETHRKGDLLIYGPPELF